MTAGDDLRAVSPGRAPSSRRDLGIVCWVRVAAGSFAVDSAGRPGRYRAPGPSSPGQEVLHRRPHPVRDVTTRRLHVGRRTCLCGPVISSGSRSRRVQRSASSGGHREAGDRALVRPDRLQRDQLNAVREPVSTTSSPASLSTPRVPAGGRWVQITGGAAERAPSAGQVASSRDAGPGSSFGGRARTGDRARRSRPAGGAGSHAYVCPMRSAR